jgi:hypothetical protein
MMCQTGCDLLILGIDVSRNPKFFELIQAGARLIIKQFAAWPLLQS